MPYIAYFIPSEETRPGRIWLRDTWGEIGLQSVLSAGAVSRAESLRYVSGGDVSGCMIRPACAAQYANARILRRARRSENPAVEMLLCENQHSTEATLARRFQREGERVLLGDGNAWLIPTTFPGARACDRQEFCYSNGARKTRKIGIPDFVQYATDEILEARIDNRYIVRSSEAELKAAALYYINLNYRIEQPEADLLGLLSPRVVWRVLSAVSASEYYASCDESKRALDSDWRVLFGEE